MSVIETTAGGVITRGQGSMDVFVFYRADAKHKEAMLHEAERDPKSGISSMGGAEVTPSGAAVTKKTWVQKRNEYPNGSYLRVYFRTVKAGVAFGHQIASIILAPRDTAPLYELAVDLPTDANSSRSKLYIIGRFDVLTPEQIEERGLHITSNGSNDLATFEELEDLPFLSLIKKEKEVAPKSVVTKKTVGTKIIMRPGTKRRIGLPR